MIVDLARELDNPEGVSQARRNHVIPSGFGFSPAVSIILPSLRDWFGKSGLLISKLRALYKTDN